MSDEAGGDSNIFDKTFDTTLDLHVVLGMCGHVWACVGPIWAPKKGMCTLKSQIRALVQPRLNLEAGSGAYGCGVLSSQF